MANFDLKKGYDIRIDGLPEQVVRDAPRPQTVALCPPDFEGIKPRLLVNEGDEVQIGTPLFQDKTHEKILFVSPGAGKVKSIIRGERRKILEIQIELAEEESWEEDNRSEHN